MNRFAWMGATTVAHAASAATLVADAMLAPRGAAPDAAIVSAGGIDVLDLLKEGLLAPGMLVSLRGIPGLDAIEPAPDGGLRIGAMATLANLAADERIRATYPALAEAASGAASPQIRAVATAGGNLLQRPRCWYFIACARAAAIALRWKAIIATTPFSTIGFVPSCIPPRWPRRWWHCARGSTLPALMVRGGTFCWRISC